jgi:putative iron-dependent peroxidase
MRRAGGYFARMSSPQPGIFALGTSSHGYLELDAETDPVSLVQAVASLREPRTTIGGVNLVCGFAPSVWRAAVPDGLPEQVHDFDHPIRGDGVELPATQHDALLWVAGSAYDVVFDVCRDAMDALAGAATVAREASSWAYRHDRDLTGFVDGTENPSVVDAIAAAVIGQGAGAGGSVLLLQQWEHDSRAWEALAVHDQERAMGRTKGDSEELAHRPDSSHVARTDQDDFGHIFRRNMPYGTVTCHGTMFVGFSSDQRRLQRMLESMAGSDASPRDELTRYTRALTGAYYFVPSVEALRAFAND